MSKLRKTLFISDLHLDENRPKTTQQFLRFLYQCDSYVDAIYILGDLFEVWIGDDENTSLHQEVIHALRCITQQLPIYFLHGNRDFLIGRKFLQQTGCTLIHDEAIIMLYETPVLLMHGDTLCTRDIAYLKARKRARNAIYQQLFLLLPLRARRKLARHFRGKSKLHTSSALKDVMDVTQEEVEHVMKKHQVEVLIHGHTHQPDIHQFHFQSIKANRIVLGAWHDKGSVLIWNETGQKTLTIF